MKSIFTTQTGKKRSFYPKAEPCTFLLKTFAALTLAAVAAISGVYAQAPNISYNSPQTYIAGYAITPLAPTNTGGAVKGGTVALPATFNDERGVAVDASGNVYVAEENGNDVKEIQTNGNVITIGSGFSSPTGVAVDASGNVFVADYGNNAIKEIAAGNGPVTTIATGFNGPYGIAIDAAGNLYVGDTNNNQVKKIPAGSSTPVVIGSGFDQPMGVAVDASGNVYVADHGYNAIKEILASNGSTATLATANGNPTGVVVDANGNVYFADTNNTFIAEIPAGGSSQVQVGSGFSEPICVAVDSRTDVFVGDYDNSDIKVVYNSIYGYHITPALPAGLVLNLNTGVISGTPTAASSTANYTVSATNSSGTGTATVNITVNLPPAPHISYSTPQVYTAGTPMATLTPTNTGGPIQATGAYAISPALPAGLSFNVNTGAISGRPATGSPATNYTITATNAGGSGTAVVNITINVPSPPNISYKSPQAFTININASPLAPSFSGGWASSSPITISSAAYARGGMAIDQSGNIYQTASETGNVIMLPANGGAPVTLASDNDYLGGIAVDAFGNIFFTNHLANEVDEIPATGGAPITLRATEGAVGIGPIALDGAGNIYVGQGSNAQKLVKYPNGGGSAVILDNAGPNGIATDKAGNVYATFSGSNQIKKYPAGGGAPVILATIQATPEAIAVDAAANVYYTDSNNEIVELTANGNTGIVASGFTNLQAFAMDSNGNIYVSDANGIQTISKVYSYTVSPALPSGLTLNTNNGVISGTPTAISPATNYTVTGQSASGNVTATVNISVINPVKPNISYSSPMAYTPDQTIVPLAPANIGGAIPAPKPTTLTSGVNPVGVAVDASGYIYFADYSNNVVRKLSPGSSIAVSIGSGFTTPSGVAVDAAGNVYVADYGNKLVKEIPAGGGSVVTIGSGYTAPYGIALDASGNIYITDVNTNAIYKMPAGGGAVTTVAAGFNDPTGLTIDASGNVYVADKNNNAIKEVPAGGGATITLGSGFSHPFGVAINAVGNLFITDQGNNAVTEIPIGRGGQFTLSRNFYAPYGIAVDNSGNVYISDTGNGDVKEILSGGYTIDKVLPLGLAFNGITGVISGTPIFTNPATTYTITGYNAQGSASAAVSIAISPGPKPNISYGTPQVYQVGIPVTAVAPVNRGGPVPPPTPATLTTGLVNSFAATVDASGNVYVVANGYVDKVPVGGGAKATIGPVFGYPTGIAVDAAGNIYVADNSHNNIIKMQAGTYAASTVASGLAAPYGLAIDASGNLYVSEDGNNSVVKISAGSSTPVTLATGFSTPKGVAVDGKGNVYVADGGTNTVKEIPVGGGSAFTIGSGFATPNEVVADATGNVFVTDAHAVRRIPFLGGSPVIIAASANFTTPAGIALDYGRNIYVTDNHTGNLTEINPGFFINPGLAGGLSFDEATGTISGTPTAAMAATSYVVTAYNSGGSDQATIEITVNPAQFPTVSYKTPQVYAVATTITPLAPAVTSVLPPGTSRIVGNPISGFKTPQGIVADAAGNIYVAESGNNDIVKIAAGTGNVSTVGSGFNAPAGLAIDAAGNLYVADYGNNEVKEVLAGGGSIITLGVGFLQPLAIAVDDAGNIFVSDSGNGAVKKMPPGGGTPVIIYNASGTPSGIAVDGSDNVYVVIANGFQTRSKKIVKIPGDGSRYSIIYTSSATDLYSSGISIDHAGNLFFGLFDGNYYYVVERPFNGGYDQTFAASTTGSLFTYVDGYDILYVANKNAGTVATYSPLSGIFISPYLPTGLNFDNTTGVISGTPTVTSPATNYTVTAWNTGGKGVGTVNIKTVAGSNSSLTNLTVSNGTLSPAFATATTSYTVAEANATTSITLTPTTTGTATAMVNGVVVASGTASAAIPLNVGPNTIGVAVTDNGGATVSNYTITANRAPSSNSALANFSINAGTLSPAFASGTTSYSTTVPNATNLIMVTPTAADATATITVNGKQVASGTPSINIALVGGPNTITTVVTAQDGTTTSTYTLTVTRQSNNNYLSALSLNPSSPLTVVSGPGYKNYTASVSGSQASIRVIPTTTDPTATIKVNGTAVASGGNSQPITLNTGINTINIVVTAQDGETRNYIITVGKGNSNAYLSALATSSGTLSPAFANTTTAYSVSVPYATSSLTVTPTLADATAKVTVNGTSVASGTASGPIALPVGNTTISTVVTAQNGITTIAYTITVTRATASNNDYLSSISLTKPYEALTTTTGPGYKNYTASVSAGTTSIEVIPTAADPTATIKVNGVTVASGSASAPIPLSGGNTTITTVVTAQDGVSTKSYIVTVNRPVSNNAYLSSISLTKPYEPLTTVSGPDYRDYTASVSASTTSIEEIPVTADATATIKVNGTTVTSGSASQPVTLSVGSNTITTVVTAQDGVTTKTYVITVTRPSAEANPLDEVSMTQPVQTPLLANDGILVHKGVSPNGDGIDDFLQIDNIAQYPDNHLAIMNRNGQLIYEAKGYDNSTKVFDGHSNKTGQMQLPGTYFFALDYTVKGITRHKTGFLVLKY